MIECCTYHAVSDREALSVPPELLIRRQIMVLDWIRSPIGIAAIAVLVILLASVTYWKRRRVCGWLRRQKIHEVELGAGPVKVKLREKDGEEQPSASAGVSFGKDNDFSGATIRRVAGRDIRSGPTTADVPGGGGPGVDFGERGRFRDAQIEDVAGRDIVEQ
jgi:hypothetical protein